MFDIPVESFFQSNRQTDRGLEAERAQLADVGTTARCAASLQGQVGNPWRASKQGNHLRREVADGNLILSADMINLIVTAFLNHEHQAVGKIININERPRFGALSLNRKG